MTDIKHNDDETWTPQIQVEMNTELIKTLEPLLASLRMKMDRYAQEGHAIATLEEIHELADGIGEYLDQFVEEVEDQLPEPEPVVCDYVMKSGKKKGQACGKPDCKSHNKGAK